MNLNFLKKKLLILVNYLSFFLSHRLEIAEAALQDGFEVFIGYGELRGADPKLLKQMGFKLNLVPIHPGSINFFKDLKTHTTFGSILIRFNLILYTSLLLNHIFMERSSLVYLVKNLVTVSGLGTLFIDKKYKNKIYTDQFFILYTNMLLITKSKNYCSK